MESYHKTVKKGERIFVGIDVHKQSWHVTIATQETQLFSGSIPGTWCALKKLLERYRGHPVEAVYEARLFRVLALRRIDGLRRRVHRYPSEPDSDGIRKPGEDG